MDALALLPDGQKLLVQVCASLHYVDTSEREVSSLLELADTPTGRFAEPPLTGYWMTRPDHDLSLLKGDTSSWQLSPGSGKKVSTRIPSACRSSCMPHAALQGQQQRSKLWEDWPVA